MLSNKLTFSLVFVLALALIAAPAFAQTTVGTPFATDPGSKGFAVYEMNTATDAQNGFTAGVTTVQEAAAGAFPNMEDFLNSGGTVELVMLVGLSTADNTYKFPAAVTTISEDAVDDLTDAQKADFAKAQYRLIITEIMWGVNTAQAGAARALPQWIEIYNNGAALGAPDNPALLFHNNRKLDRVGMVVSDFNGDGTHDDAFIVVDSVSTVDRFGRPWALKGSSGFNSADIATGVTGTPSSLTSMYRKAALKDGKYEEKDGKPKDLGRGDAAGSWEASSARANLTGTFIGTPGTFHRPNIGGGDKFDKAAVVADGNSGMGVIINEIRDDTSEANIDWVELHNRNDDGTDPVSVKDWRLRLVTAPMKADGTYDDAKAITTQLARLPDYKIPAGGYLLIVNRDPSDPGSPLAGGVNLAEIVGKNEVNRGAKHVYFVSTGLDLPGSGKYLLTLRSGDKTNTHEQFVDFAGNGFFKKAGTDMWPFRGWAVPGDRDDFNVDTLASATMSIGRIGALTGKGVYRGKSRGGNRLHKDDWQMFSNQGSIGYERDVDPATSPGTPGYGNEGGVNRIADDRGNTSATDDYAFGGTITISEVMYDAGPSWNLVQWIELYNSSLTEPVNLAGWKVEIQNKEDVQSYVDASFEFIDNTVILPNQTLLLVSRSGANDVLQQRVYDLYKNHRDDLGLPTGRVARLLSRTGFSIKLYAKLEDRGGNVTRRESMMLVDQAGNLMVSIADESREVMWELPERGEPRQSIVRQYGTRQSDNSGHDPANDGTMADSWNQSVLAGAGLSYYGHRSDIGTPGFRLGGPLPVSLSSFRPVRDAATGHVVVRWVTESELNNAGFNILRSESKTGEFQVVNLKGIIPGHGTTSEKHVYEWTDATAKPNVVYYYQIEDVSLEGNRTTLATTHLRGNVNAAGKLTTTWGDLKTQQ